MTASQAEQVVMQLTKPFFAFAKNRCATIQDAEDIAQEICIKLYRALLVRDDIAEPSKFAWTIAHNAMANYYRGRSRQGISVPIHEMTDILPTSTDIALSIEASETAEKLHREIAYLSKTRRQVVIMYYFENKRQQEIANTLGLSLGTVKWYLSDAKTELQKGMETMRTSELKFNPIEFASIYTNGSAGSMGGNGTILRSALAQNILYLIRNEAMTVNDIADALGVSPVYVENEVEFLEHNAFILKRGKGYIANVLIDNITTEYNRMMSEMYDEAADTLVFELFDTLAANIKLGEDGVICPRGDLNFALWALLPYIIAQNGAPSNAITFEEAATIRPDGGVNICHCIVKNTNAEPMKYSESLSVIGGPCWNGNNKLLLWLMDTVWGGTRVGNYSPDALWHDLTALTAFHEGELSEDDAIRVAERGYISRETFDNKTTRDKLDIVWLTKEANQRLLSAANSIREKHQVQLEKIKSMYCPETPEHMKKARAYMMQYMFSSDGIFIIFALNKLLESGKLKLPAAAQRNSLCAVMVTL